LYSNAGKARELATTLQLLSYKDPDYVKSISNHKIPLRMMSKKSEDDMERCSERLYGDKGVGILLGASRKL